MPMSDKQFIEEVYEVAFGDDAINKGYERWEVIECLKEFSEGAFQYELIQQEEQNESKEY